jgi:signal transduction histidine kinase
VVSVFVSYSRRDEGLRGRLAAHLSSLRRDGLIYDWHDRCIEPGTDWAQEIDVHLEQADVILALVSADFLASEYCVGIELSRAIERHDRGEARVIPVILRDSDWQSTVLGRLQALPHQGKPVTSWANQDAALASVARELRYLVSRNSDANPRAGSIQASTPCPYPGLLAFDHETASLFVGRESEIDDLAQRLKYQRYCVVIGASGSGKSSLVQAGLVPELARRQPGRWMFHLVRPRERSASGAARALSRIALGAAARGPQTPIHDAESQPPNLLIVVDQLEEVFAAGVDEHERRAFFRSIASVRNTGGVHLLVTLRADFYADLLDTDLAPDLAGEQMNLQPLDEPALRRVISYPAEASGAKVEPALIERLVADAAGEPGSLPLLQEALAALWERGDRRELRLSDYQAMSHGAQSGLARAMAMHADAVLADLARTSMGHADVARRVLVRLVDFGAGSRNMRRQQTIADLETTTADRGELTDVLDFLAKARLVVLGTNDAGEQVVDLAHEALIDGWPEFRRWLTDQREVEELRRRFEGAAVDWDRRGRAGGLLDEFELLEAERWLARMDLAAVGIHPLAHELIIASKAALVAASEAFNTLLAGFVSTTSQALRTPLTSIYGFAKTLNERDVLFDDQKRTIFAGYMADESDRLIHKFDQIVLVGQIEAGGLPISIIECDCRELVRDVLNEFSGDLPRGCSLSLEVIGAAPLAAADDEKLCIALRELIDNALRFSPDGNFVRVVVKDGEDAISIVIEDHGRGIADHDVERIFDKFYKGDNSGDGLGLGLFNARELIQLMHGRLAAHTSDGGTSFMVELPPSRSIKTPQ